MRQRSQLKVMAGAVRGDQTINTEPVVVRHLSTARSLPAVAEVAVAQFKAPQGAAVAAGEVDTYELMLSRLLPAQDIPLLSDKVDRAQRAVPAITPEATEGPHQILLFLDRVVVVALLKRVK